MALIEESLLVAVDLVRALPSVIAVLRAAQSQLVEVVPALRLQILVEVQRDELAAVICW